MNGALRNTLLLLAFVSGCADPEAPPANGTIEATDTDLGAEVAARLTVVRVAEGSQVNAGDTVAILAAATLPADVARQEAAVADAAAQLADLRAGSRTEEIARGEANVRRAESELALAESTRSRIEPLAAKGNVPAQQGDEARAAVAQASARLAAAREELRLLKVGPRPGSVAAATARLNEASASLAALRARQGELVLVAPVAGRVRGIWFEVGEIVPVGRPVATLSDDTRPWVRVYVGQDLFARIKPGTSATASLDVAGPSISGHVVSVSDKAEFTPRVALTEEERADLTFWVKVALDDSTGRARPGLPVTVRFALPPKTKQP